MPLWLELELGHGNLLKMQYSGHLLSHLCQHRLNRTKQTGIPTAWGQHGIAGKQLRSGGQGFPSEPKTLHLHTYRARSGKSMSTWPEMWLAMMYSVLADYYLCCGWVCGDLVDEKFGRDIVDTYFHASRFPCITCANKHAFLPYEGKAERAFNTNQSRLVCDVWLSTATTFIIFFFEVDRGDWLNASSSSRPQTVGALADLGPSYGYTCLAGQCWLGIGSGQAVMGVRLTAFHGLFKAKHLWCLRWGRMCITCW